MRLNAPKTPRTARLHVLVLALSVAVCLTFSPTSVFAEEPEPTSDTPTVTQAETPVNTTAPSGPAVETPVTNPVAEAPAGQQLASPSEPAPIETTPQTVEEEPVTVPEGEESPTPNLTAPATPAEGELATSPEDEGGEGTLGVPSDGQEDENLTSISDEAAGQTFFLESSKSDSTVIEAAGGKIAKGTNIATHSFNSSVAQMWKFVTSGKYDADGNPYYFIVSSKNANLCLDVEGGQAKNGANVRLWKKNGSNSQLWSIKVIDEELDLVSIVSKLSEKAGKTLVIDLKGGKTKNGTNVQLYTYNNSAAQHFYLVNRNPQVAAGDELPEGDGVYSVRINSNANFATDVKGGSKNDKANIQLWSHNGSDAQRLIFRSDGAGFYTIGILGSAKVLDIAGGKLIPGTNVQQYAANGSNAQKWALHLNANGSYTLINKGTGLVLDLADGNVAKGTNIQGYRDLGTARQQFQLVRDTRALIPEGIVTISPFTNSSLVFDIAGGSTSDGGKVQLYTSNGSLAQRFEVVRVSEGVYRIRTAASGGWLTGQYKEDQSVKYPVVQLGNGSSDVDDAALWKLIYDTGGYFSLQNVKFGTVLDVRSGSVAKGSAIQLYKSNGSAAQHFVFKTAELIANGVYSIRSYHGTQIDCVDASDGPTHLQTIAAKDNAAQKFQFTKTGDAFKIVNIKSGLPISATGEADGTAITTKREKGTDYQLWKVLIADGGFIKIVNVANNMSLTTRGSATGSNVVQHNQGSSPKGERWKLIKTTGTVSKPAQAEVRILMIGNSLTYRQKSGNNDPNYLPTRIETMLSDENAYVEKSTALGRGLADHLNFETNYKPGNLNSYTGDSIGTRTYGLLDGGDWDYVIFQDLSYAPIQDPIAYASNVVEMANLIRACGATPVLYGTWAYSDKTPEGEVITDTDPNVNPLINVNNGSSMTRDEMHNALQSVFQQAVNAANITLSNVDQAFFEAVQCGGQYWKLYATGNPDAKHASATGVQVAAQTIVNTLRSLMNPVQA